MTDEQVLQQAIERAVANGWENTFDFAGWKDVEGQDVQAWMIVDTPQQSRLLFNHDFAKALFGRADSLKILLKNGETRIIDDRLEPGGVLKFDDEIVLVTSIPGWQTHLTKLALAEDRIDYLRKYLEEHDANL